MAGIGVPRPIAYSIIVATEIAEFGLRDIFPDFFAETAANIGSDIAASAVGYEIGRALTSKV